MENIVQTAAGMPDKFSNLVAALSFYAGMRVDSYLKLANDLHLQIKQNPFSTQISNAVYASDNTSSVIGTAIPDRKTTVSEVPSNNVTFSGIITRVTNKQLVVKNSAGVIQTYLFSPQSVVISPEGKAVAISELKPGDNVMLVALKSGNGTQTLQRIKIINNSCSIN